jgi:hypothetical protein
MLTKSETGAIHIPAGGIARLGWRKRGEKEGKGFETFCAKPETAPDFFIFSLVTH